MGILRLRNLLDQHTRAIDDAKRRAAGRRRTAARTSAGPAGTRVIAVVARVVPDLIGTGNADDIGRILGFPVDHLGGRVARNVLRRTAQEKIAGRAYSRTVRSAVMQSHDAGVADRVVGADRGRRMHRIDDATRVLQAWRCSLCGPATAWKFFLCPPHAPALAWG